MIVVDEGGRLHPAGLILTCGVWRDNFTHKDPNFVENKVILVEKGTIWWKKSITDPKNGKSGVYKSGMIGIDPTVWKYDNISNEITVIINAAMIYNAE